MVSAARVQLQAQWQRFTVARIKKIVIVQQPIMHYSLLLSRL
jgi:hypothetical protein